MSTQVRSTTYASEPPILWEVVEQHLDEAEFLLEQWKGASNSPSITLEILSKSIEARLEAHLDGLLVGGTPVVERLLEPALEDESAPARAKASALVMLHGSPGDRERVLDAAMQAQGELSGALSSALAQSLAPALDSLLLERFGTALELEAKAFWLSVLTRRNTDPGEALDTFINSPGLAQHTAVTLEAAAQFGRRQSRSLAERFLRSSDPLIRRCAIRAGLEAHSPEAWQACLAQARVGAYEDPETALWVAVLGTEREVSELLSPGLEEPRTRLAALWALGFAGWVQAGDLCLSSLMGDDDRAARQAAETLSFIGGFDLNTDAFQAPRAPSDQDMALPPLEEDLPYEELLLEGVDELPPPNRASITRWWNENRARLIKQQPLLRGEPRNTESMLRALREASLRRRHGVARALSIESGGRLRFETESFASRQKRDLNRLVASDAK